VSGSVRQCQAVPGSARQRVSSRGTPMRACIIDQHTACAALPSSKSRSVNTAGGLSLQQCSAARPSAPTLMRALTRLPGSSEAMLTVSLSLVTAAARSCGLTLTRTLRLSLADLTSTSTSWPGSSGEASPYAAS
jgi:hypothetical protein